MAVDYSLNIPHLIRQFKDETLVINADKNGRTQGIWGRRFRQLWLSDLLVATGHTVNRLTGEVTYTRKQGE